MRLLLLIIVSWIAGWFSYGLSLLFKFHESPFTYDVAIMGFGPLIFGLPFCLLVIVPVFLVLRKWLKQRAGSVLLAIVAVLLSFGFMFLLFGSPLRSPESLLFHIYAGISSVVFGLGFPWAITKQEFSGSE